MRPDLEAGGDPLARILETAESTVPGASFLLVAPFEPLPLYRLLGKRGFVSETERLEDGSYRVLFTRNG